jgi:acyl carrier protein
MPSKDDIHQTLKTLASRHFGKDLTHLGPDDDFFEALDIDSYQAMELLTELEGEFDVEIPDYEVQDVKTFGGLAEVIGRRV